jgi:nicotinate phosphoribosyltransferase
MTDGLQGVYGGSLALLTDLYQLTMAAGYWKAGLSEREAVFHLTYRRAPFKGGYAIAAGIAPALAFLERFRFTAEDLAYLATLRDNENKQLFEDRTSRSCACADRSSRRSSSRRRFSRS